MTTPQAAPKLNDAQRMRQNWLRVLAMSPVDELTSRAAPVLEHLSFTWLRRPETGLLRLQGRLDGAGDRFNLGDITVSRCVVKAETGEVGVGYVTGRALEHCAMVARLDALLQQPARQPTLMANLVEPLQAMLEQSVREASAQTRRSRVEFFTLTPESHTL